MSHKHAGGCDHIHTHSDNGPIDSHTCHCSICKRVTGQDTTHVVFFNHGDLEVDNLDGLDSQPFNDQNPDGPLELCTCSTCGTPIMLNAQKQGITPEEMVKNVSIERQRDFADFNIKFDNYHSTHSQENKLVCRSRSAPGLRRQYQSRRPGPLSNRTDAR